MEYKGEADIMTLIQRLIESRHQIQKADLELAKAIASHATTTAACFHGVIKDIFTAHNSNLRRFSWKHHTNSDGNPYVFRDSLCVNGHPCKDVHSKHYLVAATKEIEELLAIFTDKELQGLFGNSVLVIVTTDGVSTKPLDDVIG